MAHLDGHQGGSAGVTVNASLLPIGITATRAPPGQPNAGQRARPARLKLGAIVEDKLALAIHAERVEALRDPAAYPHPVAGVETIETHISTVLLAGDYAYKLKKPVNLGFADFSTIERRRRFCEEEIRLNRRGAPQLYLDVVPVTGRPAGGPRAVRLGSATGPADGPVLDYAVRMRRFAAGARLDQVARAGRLTPEHIDQLAEAIAAYHDASAPAPSAGDFGSAAQVCRWADDNLAALGQARLEDSDTQRVRDLRAWTAAEFERRAALFDRRRAGGFVRECHGDLHLGNIVLLDGRPVLFDCIEFNDELRFIDVASDIAFAFMDLIDYGMALLAWRLLGRWLELTGDYEGLGTLRFYAVYRALVRAKIAVIRRGQASMAPGERAGVAAELHRYLDVAAGLAHPPAPQLVLTCGVTGSGKSTVAQQLAERIGAVRVRSDLERKRLHAMRPTDRAGAAGGVGAGLYAQDETARTYARLRDLAGAILDAGFTVIVDATFLRRGQRDAFAGLARERGARLRIVECVAAVATLRSRVVARLAAGADPSDATPEVLAHQLQSAEPLTPAEQASALRVDTDRTPLMLDGF